MLERAKRDIYLCQRDHSQTTVEVYGLPIKVRVTKKPIRSEFLIERAGQVNRDIYLCTVPNDIGQKFKNGDKCFVKLMPPSMHNPSCLEADYKVSAVRDGATFTEIVLEGNL